MPNTATSAMSIASEPAGGASMPRTMPRLFANKNIAANTPTNATYATAP